MVARVSLNPVVRTLPHTLLTASTVQIIDMDRFGTFCVASSSSNGSCMYKYFARSEQLTIYTPSHDVQLLTSAHDCK